VTIRPMIIFGKAFNVSWSDVAASTAARQAALQHSEFALTDLTRVLLSQDFPKRVSTEQARSKPC
jgi:hypothetical protein